MRAERAARAAHARARAPARARRAREARPARWRAKQRAEVGTGMRSRAAGAAAATAAAATAAALALSGGVVGCAVAAARGFAAGGQAPWADEQLRRAGVGDPTRYEPPRGAKGGARSTGTAGPARGSSAWARCARCRTSRSPPTSRLRHEPSRCARRRTAHGSAARTRRKGAARGGCWLGGTLARRLLAAAAAARACRHLPRGGHERERG